MTDFVMALVNVGAAIFQAIEHAVAGRKEDALAQALLAQRKLIDAIAREQLKG